MRAWCNEIHMVCEKPLCFFSRCFPGDLTPFLNIGDSTHARTKHHNSIHFLWCFSQRQENNDLKCTGCCKYFRELFYISTQSPIREFKMLMQCFTSLLKNSGRASDESFSRDETQRVISYEVYFHKYLTIFQGRNKMSVIQKALVQQ